MNIIIVANFCGDFSSSDNNRFLYIAKLLAQNNKVEIITSSFRHETKQQRSKINSNYPFKISFIHEPGYAKNISIKRFYSHFVWGINVTKYLMRSESPDVIYCAVPSLTGPFFISNYCKKNGIKFVIDVQDLWPEAFKMIIDNRIIDFCIYKPLKHIADTIYRNASDICAVSETYGLRAKNVNSDASLTTVFLGTDLNQFDNYKGKEPILKKNINEIWLSYCGTLGASYDLKCVIDALEMLNNYKLKLIVMGDGPRKAEFEEYARKKNIACEFTGRLPYHKMCAVLAECDIVVNPIVGSSVASIINKHADYAAVGRPVINTQNSCEYRELVEKYQMGFNCEPGDSLQMAKDLNILINDSNLRLKMGKNARICAEDCFDRKYTYKTLIKVITEE